MTETLWDTGAEVSLVSKACAEKLVAAGAEWDHTGRPVELLGVGDGVTWAWERVKYEVNLHDER